MRETLNDALRMRWALLPIRLVIGFGFMAHGVAKLTHGPAGFAKLLQWIGVPFAGPTAWVSMLLELVGGAALFLGAFVEVVSVPLIVMMLVAMLGVHLRNGFSSIQTVGLTEAGPQFGPPGFEINLLYIAGLIGLIVAGPGAWAITGRMRSSGAVARAARPTPASPGRSG
jgi:putative oxidoreductase